MTKDNNCTVCEWSQWTPFTDCSDACNGTQSRYRTYDGPNCPNKQTEEDKKACSSNCSVVCYDTVSNGTIVQYNVGDLVQTTRCNKSYVRMLEEKMRQTRIFSSFSAFAVKQVRSKLNQSTEHVSMGNGISGQNGANAVRRAMEHANDTVSAHRQHRNAMEKFARSYRKRRSIQ